MSNGKRATALRALLPEPRIVDRARLLGCSIGHLSGVERGKTRAGKALRERLAHCSGETIARVNQLCAAAERSFRDRGARR